MADTPDRVSQPSPEYDRAVYGSDPAELDRVLEHPTLLRDTVPCEPPPPTCRQEDCIPGPTLRETLGAIEATLAAHGDLLRTIVGRLTAVESVASGSRQASLDCYGLVRDHCSELARAHRRCDAVGAPDCRASLVGLEGGNGAG